MAQFSQGSRVSPLSGFSLYHTVCSSFVLVFSSLSQSKLFVFLLKNEPKAFRRISAYLLLTRGLTEYFSSVRQFSQGGLLTPFISMKKSFCVEAVCCSYFSLDNCYGDLKGQVLYTFPFFFLWKVGHVHHPTVLQGL